MRILHIVPSVAPETGGPARSVPALCKGLARAGHEVVLFASSWPNCGAGADSDWRKRDFDGYVVEMFPARTALLTPGLPSSPELIDALRTRFSDFDIVHTHSIWNPVASLAMRTLRQRGAPYCVTPRGMLDPVVFSTNRWKKKIWAFLWEKANVEGAALVHFTTEREYRKALRCGWRVSTTVVAPNAVDIDYWHDLPPRTSFESDYPQVRGREVILFVGRINWVKNLDKLVQSLEIVRRARPSTMLVCVGPDSDNHRLELEAMAESLGVRRDILFTGMLQGKCLKAAYSRGDILALVSQKENFGMAVAEALASGLPVVLSEGVDLGVDWPPNTAVRRVRAQPEEIAGALAEMLQYASSRTLPDPRARALARRSFGFAQSMELVTAYESVLFSN